MTRTVVATYPYTDESGASLYEAVRYDPKDFSQRVPLGSGLYAHKLNGVRRVPYHLADLLNRKARETVFVVEGEKDADALRALGFCATTNAGGCGWNWTPDFAESFRGSKRIAVVPDCDEGDPKKGTRKGREAAVSRAQMLLEVCDDVRVIDLDPARHDGYDVSDWLVEGHTADELKELVGTAPRVRPPAPVAAPIALPHELDRKAAFKPAAFVSVGELLNESDKELPPLVDGVLGCGATALIASKPKVGKTSWLLNLALAVARGSSFLGHPAKQGPVLYVALEGNRNEWRRVLRAMGAKDDDPLHFFVDQAPQDAMRWLRESAEKYKPVLIIVDTFQRLARLKDMNDYAAVTNASEPLVEIAQTFNATLALAHHAKKNNKDGDDGDSVLGSTALYGFVDTLVILKKGAEGRRTMKTSQRYGEDLEETVIALDAHTKVLTAAGSRVDVDRAECEASILKALADAKGWLERSELLDDIEARNKTKTAALQQVIDDGRVARVGAGKRGDPYLYALPGTPLSDSIISVEKVSSSHIPAIYRELETGNGKPLPGKALFAPRPSAIEEGSGTRNDGSGTPNAGTTGTPGTTNAEGSYSVDEAVFE